jgi:hypothetical protein
MRNILRLAVTSLALAAVPHPAWAQFPGWNGLGVSVGGGWMGFGQARGDPVASLVRPEDDSTGAVVGGFHGSLGTRRWAIILPELHAYSGPRDPNPVAGTITLDSTTVTVEPSSQSVTAFAVLGGVRVALVRSGRVWVQGGIGGGSVTSSLRTEDQRIAVALTGGSGLALSGAAGVSVWARSTAERRSSVDVEVHWLRIGSDSLSVSAPSLRVGWKTSP